jgi:hypothetical protein
VVCQLEIELNNKTAPGQVHPVPGIPGEHDVPAVLVLFIHVYVHTIIPGTVGIDREVGLDPAVVDTDTLDNVVIGE